MSDLPNETIAERRVRLAGEIARQRGELAKAWTNLEKPVLYAEYGLRGFGFIRQNSWILAVLPATLSIGSSLWSLRKGTKEPHLSPRQKQILEAVEKKPKGLLGNALKLGGHGWKLFKLYRRVRPFFLP